MKVALTILCAFGAQINVIESWFDGDCTILYRVLVRAADEVDSVEFIADIPLDKAIGLANAIAQYMHVLTILVGDGVDYDESVPFVGPYTIRRIGDEN